MISTIVLLFAATVTTMGAEQRSGYPKLFRCQSAFQAPVAEPDWSPSCLDYRERELSRVKALPVAERIVRVKELRARIGLADGEGLDVTPSGTLRPARVEMSARGH